MSTIKLKTKWAQCKTSTVWENEHDVRVHISGELIRIPGFKPQETAAIGLTKYKKEAGYYWALKATGGQYKKGPYVYGRRVLQDTEVAGGVMPIITIIDDPVPMKSWDIETAAGFNACQLVHSAIKAGELPIMVAENCRKVHPAIRGVRGASKPFWVQCYPYLVMEQVYKDMEAKMPFGRWYSKKLLEAAERYTNAYINKLIQKQEEDLNKFVSPVMLQVKEYYK
jgi:hypothetical protein